MSIKKLLIVDDNTDILKIWKRALRDEGFTLFVAERGDQALNILQENDISIIFTDFDMPGMDGMRLLEKIKRMNPNVCINMMTGNGSIQMAVRAMKNGACDYLLKPFKVNELGAMAYRCLQHLKLKEETKRLRTSVANLEELLRLKSEFISNVSHELRTPFFAMGAAMEIIFEDEKTLPDTNSTELIAVLKNNYDRLAKLVENILDFSKLEQGRMAPQFEKINIRKLCQQTVHSLIPLMQKKEIEFIDESDTPLKGEYEIDVDQGQVNQILINLIGNAIKFTPAKGQIGISVKGLKDQAEISVWDSGKGIPKNYTDRIFDRFYQVDGSITREAGGTGIGLSIVKSLVEMHDGTISVESELGKGTKFTIRLPKTQKGEAVHG